MIRKLVAVSTCMLAVGCSSTPTFQTGPDAEVTHDGLTRMDGTTMDIVWARKDIDVRGVTKVIFNGVGVEYRNVTGPYSGRAGSGTSTLRTNSRSEFQLDAATRERFEAEISSAFLEEIKRSEVFEVVEEPGPETLLVNIGLFDVVSRVPPETVGSSRIFIDRVGEASLVLELRDSESNTILIRAVDRRAAENPVGGTESNRVTNAAEVRRLGRRWGTIIRTGLDTLLTDGPGT